MSHDDERLEAAIPNHLLMQRIQASRCPFTARPYPTYVARFDPAVTCVVMGYFGVQSREAASWEAMAAAGDIERSFALPDGPGHWDVATGLDALRHVNRLYAVYWDDPDAFARWHASAPVRAWWDADARERGEIGLFREIFSPRATDYETHFSTHKAEGVAVLARAMSGEIAEHAYWGSARDRIPRSQVDRLGEDETPLVAAVRGGRRVRVPPRDNLCLIRSGQDWSDADAGERDLYERDLRPHLERGMRFLRDDGRSVGCICSRFVDVLQKDGAASPRSYGMSLWRSLGHLEAWAASHPTHLAIFGAGVAYMRKLGPSAGLRTYHEIAVVRSEHQVLEYINCHARTGMRGMDDVGAVGA